MSEPKEQKDARLLIGLMYRDERVLERVIKDLNLGDHTRSEPISFDFTSFYEKEFGTDLKKVYLAYEGGFVIDRLPEIKLRCYRVEKLHSARKRRRINIDPGYITATSVVLASFKERAHRVYLRDGVYADLQLVFEHGIWSGFRWTFKDLLHPKVQEFLLKIREKI